MATVQDGTPIQWQCEPLGDDPSIMTCNGELVPVPIVTDTFVPDNGRQGQGINTRQTGPSVNTDVVERVLETTARGVASAGRFTWGVLKSMGEGLADMAVGLAHVVVHPVQTAQGLTHAALHPMQTSSALWTSLRSSARRIASGDSEAIGRAALEVGTLVLGAGVTKIGKLDTLADAAHAADTATNAGRIAAKGEPTRFINSVRIVDRRAGTVLAGTVDLKPTLDRIASGGRFPHRNDGTIFQNRPLLGRTAPELPAQPPGYYREYVHPTPGVSGPGPQRIVVGQDGEIYYTPDHYQTFIPLQ